jgi:MerR family mercuric resistance operon transcriptional regulator
VQFIKQAQGLGFSLNEIKKLLALRVTPRARCADVRMYAAHKIEDIDGKIRSLARMRKTLEKLIAECSGDGPATQCPILESLDTEPSTVIQRVKSVSKGEVL